MAMDTQEKAETGGRPAYIWIIALVGVAAVFVAMLVCGLALGFGFFALTSPKTTQPAAAQAVEAEESPVEKAAAEAEAGEAEPALPKVGNSAPGFTLTDLEGNTVSLADYEGQPVLINFWATWCGPCEAEMPEINQAYQDYKDEGLVVLAVNLQEHPDTIRSFVDYYKLEFLILLDRQEDVSQQYQARALPTTYFVDASGTIVHVYYGQMDEKALKIGLRKIMPDVEELQIQQ